jgi:hypothetical protein
MILNFSQMHVQYITSVHINNLANFLFLQLEFEIV